MDMRPEPGHQPRGWECSSFGFDPAGICSQAWRGCCLLFSRSVESNLWTVARQTPLSMGFPRQEYWSGLLFPPPADLPNPRIKPRSPTLAGRFFTAETLGKSMEG